ncbi:hypothetical protein EJ08DRAFT_665489 [Tothia fuscella]|uniref:Uncharacterized protein n=1 Tax=Tothia fuscella TaxID=1048955 RepID=A0A9P4NGG8_9PEZI|nr:hypothetical protein EJ08DRAFT_665489 [Tothia fuscella]
MSVNPQADIVLASQGILGLASTIYKRVCESGATSPTTIDALALLEPYAPLSPEYHAALASAKSKATEQEPRKLYKKLRVQQPSGPNQIKSVKHMLEPFIELLHVPDAVADLDDFLRGEAGVTAKKQGGVSILPIDRIPALLEHMRSINQEDSNAVLNVYGLQGAAWIAFYCKDMLGLKTCVISVKEDDKTNEKTTFTIPLKPCKSYADAKVRFFVNSTESAISLHHLGRLKDFIGVHQPASKLTLDSYPEQLVASTNSDKTSPRCVYSCDKRVFVHWHFEDMCSRREYEPISHFVAAHTMQNIANYIKRLDASRKDTTPEAAMAILGVLGFNPCEPQFYRDRIDALACSIISYDPVHEERMTGLVDVRLDSDADYRWLYIRSTEYMSPLFWDQPELSKEDIKMTLTKLGDRDKEFRDLRNKEYFSPKAIEARHTATSQFDGPLRRMFRIARDYITLGPGYSSSKMEEEPDNTLFYVLQHAIKIASVLAFTDWVDSVRRLSSDCFKPQPPELAFLTLPREPPNQDTYASQQPFVKEAIALSTSLSKYQINHVLPWTPGWIGLQLPGIVVLRYLACLPESRCLKGCLVSYMIGHILVEGECPIDNFREADQLDVEHWRYPTGGKDTAMNHESPPIGLRTISPRDEFYERRVQTKVKVEKTNALIQSELVYDNDIMPLSHRLIENNTYHALVTKPCPHPVDAGITKIRWRDEYRLQGFDFQEGFWIQRAEQTVKNGYNFLLQHVNNNPTGQWVACHLEGNDTSLVTVIFQRQSCLHCLLMSADKMIKAKFPIIEPGTKNWVGEPETWTLAIVPDVGDVVVPEKRRPPLLDEIHYFETQIDAGTITEDEAVRQLTLIKEEQEAKAAAERDDDANVELVVREDWGT